MSSEKDERITIFTIGHSKLAIEIFISLLIRQKIRTLADIRSVPYSRFCPQFNAKRLEASLAEASIGYAFLGDRLGGRISDPECFIGKVIPPKGANFMSAVDYEALREKTWFNEGIEALLALAKRSRTAIACAEEDPAKCHRNILVGRRLTELGHRVSHIRKDGSIDEDLGSGSGQAGLFG
jgi:uncharacterized protein (DUF488 family)